MMSPLETAATHFDLGLNRNQFQRLRNVMIRHQACIFTSWKDVQEVNKECTPRGHICELDEEGNAYFQIPTAAVAHFHIRRILEDPYVIKVIASFATDPNVAFTFIFKVGADGSNGQRIYQFLGSISNVFTTQFCSIQIRAEKKSTGQFRVIWANPSVNSESAHCYLRIAFEKEVRGKQLFLASKFIYSSLPI